MTDAAQDDDDDEDDDDDDVVPESQERQPDGRAIQIKQNVRWKIRMRTNELGGGAAAGGTCNVTKPQRPQHKTREAATTTIATFAHSDFDCQRQPQATELQPKRALLSAMQHRRVSSLPAQSCVWQLSSCCCCCCCCWSSIQYE